MLISTRLDIIPLANDIVTQEALLISSNSCAQKAQMWIKWTKTNYRKLGITYPKNLFRELNRYGCLALYCAVHRRHVTLTEADTYYKEKEAPGEPRSHAATAVQVLQIAMVL
ncbi:hypothetical protein BOTBODRAFT_524638 [Botryobasidium botryosum FD-172 SS1]|uniref:Uncharacterized protein n=1 Tax=Botryobasidium botryosum (strain FD-172 SS1) TaxID=930990 RepID=A0A067M181_BOTB1|nr:hypothetical protein BOTBODRAFT_524638 [Botryobasidium botryosum FD-172 SS1]